METRTKGAYDLKKEIVKQFTENNFSENELSYKIAGFDDEIELIQNNCVIDSFGDNPTEFIVGKYLELINRIKNIPNELRHLTKTEEVKQKTSYSILPNGDTFEVGIYNHLSFYIAWIMVYDVEEYLKCTVMSNGEIMELVFSKYKFIEFSTDGDKNHNAIILSEIEPTRKQKEKLLQMYEVNGIANRYFEEVEQV